MNNLSIDREELEEILNQIEVNVPDGTLPNPDMVSYYMLENRRILFLDTDVGDNTITIQRMILRWNLQDYGKPEEERQPIRLFIFSYGGLGDMMWSLVDTIEASKTPVYTINFGIAGSAASAIFVAGKKRYMLKNAQVVIHEGSAQIEGDAIKVLDGAQSYKEQLRRLREFYLSRTKIPRAQLTKKRSNDWYLDSKFCVENGVCDAVVETLDEVLV